MTDATDSGASIQERILAQLEPEPIVEETTIETETEETIEDEVEVPEDTGEESTEETQEDSEEVDGETLEVPVLAEYLGLDADKLDVNDAGELVIRTKIDGEEGQATLQDLVKSYQLEGHLNKQNMEVAEERKRLKAKLEETTTQTNERIQQAEDLIAAVYQDFMSEYESIDWQELRERGDGSYADTQTLMNQRKEKLAESYQKLQEQRKATENAGTGLDEIKKQESAKLAQALNWSTEADVNRDLTEISKYVQSSTIDQDAFNNVIDHGIYLALLKAAKYDAIQKEAPRVKNKVRKAPKLVKPGAKKVRSNADDEARLRSNIKKSGGKPGSMADYLLKTGKV